jgi:hypothetical protein
MGNPIHAETLKSQNWKRSKVGANKEKVEGKKEKCWMKLRGMAVAGENRH